MLEPLKFKVVLDLSEVENAIQSLGGQLPAFQKDMSVFLDKLTVASKDIRSNAISAKDAIPLIKDFKDTWQAVLPPDISDRFTSLMRSLNATGKNTSAAADKVNALSGSLKDFDGQINSTVKAYETLGNASIKESDREYKDRQTVNKLIEQDIKRSIDVQSKLNAELLSEKVDNENRIGEEIRRVRLRLQQENVDSERRVNEEIRKVRLLEQNNVIKNEKEVSSEIRRVKLTSQNEAIKNEKETNNEIRRVRLVEQNEQVKNIREINNEVRKVKLAEQQVSIKNERDTNNEIRKVRLAGQADAIRSEKTINDEIRKVKLAEQIRTIKDEKETNNEIRKARIAMQQETVKNEREIDEEIRKIRLNVHKLGKKDLKDVTDSVDEFGKKGFGAFSKWDRLFSKILIRIGTFSAITGIMQKLGGAIADITRKTYELSKEAAKFEDTSTAFRVLASQVTSADLALANVRRAAGGVVDEFQLMQSATQAAIAGLPVGKIDDLMKGARALGPLIGREVPESFERLTNAIVKQERRLLDELGIVIRANDAYKTYADSVNKSADALTANEKKTAFLNAVLASINEKVLRLGGNLDQSQLPFLKFDSAVKNLSVTFGSWISDTLKVPDILTSLTTHIDNLSNSFMTLPRKAAEASSDFLEAFEGYRKYSKEVEGSIPAMVKKAEELHANIQSGTMSIYGQAEAEKELNNITVILSRNFPMLADLLKEDLTKGLKSAAEEATKLNTQYKSLLSIGAPKLGEAIEKNQETFDNYAKTSQRLKSDIGILDKMSASFTDTQSDLGMKVRQVTVHQTDFNTTARELFNNLSAAGRSAVEYHQSLDNVVNAQGEFNSKLSRTTINSSQTVLQTKAVIDAMIEQGIATRSEIITAYGHNKVVQEALNLGEQQVGQLTELQKQLEGATADYDNLVKSIRPLKDLSPTMFRSIAPEKRTIEELEALNRAFAKLKEGLVPVVGLNVAQNLDKEAESQRVINGFVEKYLKLREQGLLQTDEQSNETALAFEKELTGYGLSIKMLEPFGKLQLKIEQKTVEAIDHKTKAIINSAVIQADTIKSTVDDEVEATGKIAKMWETTAKKIAAIDNYSYEQHQDVLDKQAKADNDHLEAKRNREEEIGGDIFERRLERAREYHKRLIQDEELVNEEATRLRENGLRKYIESQKDMVKSAEMSNEKKEKLLEAFNKALEAILKHRRDRYIDNEKGIVSFVESTQKDILQIERTKNKDSLQKATETFELKVKALSKNAREEMRIIKALADFRNAANKQGSNLDLEIYKKYYDDIAKINTEAEANRFKQELDALELSQEYKGILQQEFLDQVDKFTREETKKITDGINSRLKIALEADIIRLRAQGETNDAEIQNLIRFKNAYGLELEGLNDLVQENAEATQKDISKTLFQYSQKMGITVQELAEIFPTGFVTEAELSIDDSDIAEFKRTGDKLAGMDVAVKIDTVFDDNRLRTVIDQIKLLKERYPSDLVTTATIKFSEQDIEKVKELEKLLQLPIATKAQINVDDISKIETLKDSIPTTIETTLDVDIEKQEDIKKLIDMFSTEITTKANIVLDKDSIAHAEELKDMFPAMMVTTAGIQIDDVSLKEVELLKKALPQVLISRVSLDVDEVSAQKLEQINRELSATQIYTTLDIDTDVLSRKLYNTSFTAEAKLLVDQTSIEEIEKLKSTLPTAIVTELEIQGIDDIDKITKLFPEAVVTEGQVRIKQTDLEKVEELKRMFPSEIVADATVKVSDTDIMKVEKLGELLPSVINAKIDVTNIDELEKLQKEMPFLSATLSINTDDESVKELISTFPSKLISEGTVEVDIDRENFDKIRLLKNKLDDLKVLTQVYATFESAEAIAGVDKLNQTYKEFIDSGPKQSAMAIQTEMEEWMKYRQQLDANIQKIELAAGKEKEQIEAMIQFRESMGLETKYLYDMLDALSKDTLKQVEDTISEFAEKILKPLRELGDDIPDLLEDIKRKAEEISEGFKPPDDKNFIKSLKSQSRAIATVISGMDELIEVFDPAEQAIFRFLGTSVKLHDTLKNVQSIAKQVGEETKMMAGPENIKLLPDLISSSMELMKIYKIFTDAVYKTSQQKVKEEQARLKAFKAEFRHAAREMGDAISEGIMEGVDIDWDVLLETFVGTELASRLAEAAVDAIGPSILDMKKAITVSVGKGETFESLLETESRDIEKIIVAGQGVIRRTGMENLKRFPAWHYEKVLKPYFEEKVPLETITANIVKERYGIGTIVDKMGDVRESWGQIEPHMKDVSEMIKSIFGDISDTEDDIKEAKLKTFRAITEPQANQIVVLMGAQLDHLAKIASNTTALVQQQYPAVDNNTMQTLQQAPMLTPQVQAAPAMNDLNGSSINNNENVMVDISVSNQFSDGQELREGFILDKVVPIISEEESRLISRKKRAIGYSKTFR